MKLLETSYLIHYEKGRDAARTFFEANEHESLTASIISMFELAFGVVWSDGRSLEKLRDSLLWVDFLGFEIADAIEGARIQPSYRRGESAFQSAT